MKCSSLIAGQSRRRFRVAGDFDIGRLDDQDVVGRAIDPRQVPHQVADVRSDPVIAQFPRVNGNAHLGESYQGRSPFSRSIKGARPSVEDTP